MKDSLASAAMRFQSKYPWRCVGRRPEGINDCAVMIIVPNHINTNNKKEPEVWSRKIPMVVTINCVCDISLHSCRRRRRDVLLQ